MTQSEAFHEESADYPPLSERIMPANRSHANSFNKKNLLHVPSKVLGVQPDGKGTSRIATEGSCSQR